MPPVEYTVVSMTQAELDEERAVLGGLADSVRALADASLRTTVGYDEVAAVRDEVDRLTKRLTEQQIPGAFGVSLTESGVVRGHGNAVVGLRNPIAPPLHIECGDEHVGARFTLGALYEGPPGAVHGGVAALVLDQVFGEAAAAGGAPGMTGTLTLRYEQFTPLGACSAEAWVDRVEGVKTIVKGELRRADGETTRARRGRVHPAALGPRDRLRARRQATAVRVTGSALARARTPQSVSRASSSARASSSSAARPLAPGALTSSVAPRGSRFSACAREDLLLGRRPLGAVVAR